MSAYAGLSRRRLLLAGVGALLSLAGAARAAAGDRLLLKRFAAAPFVVARTRKPVRIALRIGAIRAQLDEISASPASTLLLRCGGVRVARPPGVVWRVYVSPPRTAPRAVYFVGNIALFGAGVGASAPPAEFEFRVDRAVARSLRTKGDMLVLTFVPAGPLVDGEPTTPLPRAELRVERLSIRVETL